VTEVKKKLLELNKHLDGKLKEDTLDNRGPWRDLVVALGVDIQEED
jgi:hypothetical protein